MKSSLANILDLPENEVPVTPEPVTPYRPPTTCRNVKDARLELQKLQHHLGAPQDYLTACEACQPKEIEFMNLVLGGAEHIAAATKAFGLQGRSATNKAAILTTKTPRVMLALQLGRRAAAMRGEYNCEEAMARFTMLAEEARAKGQYASAIRAEETKAKLAGLLRSDETRVTVNVGDPRSDDELRQRSAQLARELGISQKAIEGEATRVAVDVD